MKAEKSFKLEGITCAACVRAVEKAVTKIDGINEVNVNLATEKMIVVYDNDKTSGEDIIEAVNKAGYKALSDEDLREITIPVEGMT